MRVRLNTIAKHLHAALAEAELLAKQYPENDQLQALIRAIRDGDGMPVAQPVPDVTESDVRRLIDEARRNGSKSLRLTNDRGDDQFITLDDSGKLVVTSKNPEA